MDDRRNRRLRRRVDRHRAQNTWIAVGVAWVVATLGLDMATAGATAATCRTSSADFGWALGGRLLVNLGNALGTTYLLYFLQDDLELDDPDGGLLLLSSVYVLLTHGSSVWAGRASAGYGRTSVDQALITAVLPDAASRAKDLGIMNVGSVGPRTLAPSRRAGDQRTRRLPGAVRRGRCHHRARCGARLPDPLRPVAPFIPSCGSRPDRRRRSAHAEPSCRTCLRSSWGPRR